MTLLRSSLLKAACTGALALFGTAALAVPMVAVDTGNRLVGFDSATPGTISGTITITGLQAGEAIVGIDRRPATGQVFALGSSSRLYALNLVTGAATQVGGVLSTALNGTSFGMDFNPTVDRIRVVSNTGQNLRLNPNTGAVAAVDGTLMLNGAPTGADAAGYTNNFAGATATTLYVINSATDTLYTQNVQDPANAFLTAVGALGVNTSDVLGFEITSGGQALAALSVGGTSQLYNINLTTGAATLVSALGANNLIGLSTAQSADVGNVVVPANTPGGLLLLLSALGLTAVVALRRRV